MSEKAEKKSEAPAAAADKAQAKPPAGKLGGLLSKTPVLLGGVMIIEALVLFAGFRILGGGQPHPAVGADLVDPTAPTEGKGATTKPSFDDKNRLVELNLVDYKFPNKVSGHAYMYDVSIFVTVKPEDEKNVKADITDHGALIQDRVRTIIAELDPDKLSGSEPGLETLRRQIKYQLDEMLGEGLIQEVLVPKCIPYRTDY